MVCKSAYYPYFRSLKKKESGFYYHANGVIAPVINLPVSL